MSHPIEITQQSEIARLIDDQDGGPNPQASRCAAASRQAAAKRPAESAGGNSGQRGGTPVFAPDRVFAPQLVPHKASARVFGREPYGASPAGRGAIGLGRQVPDPGCRSHGARAVA